MGGIFHDEINRGRESQGSPKACSNLSERDGKDQGEGSPKQECSYWFARSSWLATVARTSWLAIVAQTSILFGTWPMLYYVSLALSVSCLVFVIVFFFFVAPYWFAVAEFTFSEYIWYWWLWYYCCFSCFRMGFYFVTTGWIFLDQLMWEFNQSINQSTTSHLACSRKNQKCHQSVFDVIEMPPWTSGYNVRPLSRNLWVRDSAGVHFSSDFRSGKREDASTKSPTFGWRGVGVLNLHRDKNS